MKKTLLWSAAVCLLTVNPVLASQTIGDGDGPPRSGSDPRIIRLDDLHLIGDEAHARWSRFRATQQTDTISDDLSGESVSIEWNSSRYYFEEEIDDLKSTDISAYSILMNAEGRNFPQGFVFMHAIVTNDNDRDLAVKLGDVKPQVSYSIDTWSMRLRPVLAFGQYIGGRAFMLHALNQQKDYFGEDIPVERHSKDFDDLSYRISARYFSLQPSGHATGTELPDGRIEVDYPLETAPRDGVDFRIVGEVNGGEDGFVNIPANGSILVKWYVEPLTANEPIVELLPPGKKPINCLDVNEINYYSWHNRDYFGNAIFLDQCYQAQLIVPQPDEEEEEETPPHREPIGRINDLLSVEEDEPLPRYGLEVRPNNGPPIVTVEEVRVYSVGDFVEEDFYHQLTTIKSVSLVRVSLKENVAVKVRGWRNTTQTLPVKNLNTRLL